MKPATTDIAVHAPAPATHSLHSHRSTITVALKSDTTLVMFSFHHEDVERIEEIRSVLEDAAEWCRGWHR